MNFEQASKLSLNDLLIFGQDPQNVDVMKNLLSGDKFSFHDIVESATKLGYSDIINYCRKYKPFNTRETFTETNLNKCISIAISNGDLECIKSLEYLTSNPDFLGKHIVYIIKLGHAHILEYTEIRGFNPFFREINFYLIAIQYGHLNCIKVLHKMGYYPDDWAWSFKSLNFIVIEESVEALESIKCGNLDFLKYFYLMGCSMKSVLYYVIKYQQLHFVAFVLGVSTPLEIYDSIIRALCLEISPKRFECWESIFSNSNVNFTIKQNVHILKLLNGYNHHKDEIINLMRKYFKDLDKNISFYKVFCERISEKC